MNNKKKETEQEFERLARRHRSTIFSVCYMFSKDEDEVADLFQESLINLWDAFQRFRRDSAERTWVYRVALNTCISLSRKEKRRRGARLELDINLFSPDDEDTRQFDLLRRRIQRLQPFDRAIVLLWLEGISYEEIGAIVGITPKNVGVRLYRIREQLKQMED